MVKVAPSLLSANFACLKDDIEKIENGKADWLHYDVMDGHFVPNISFGYSILKDVSKVTNLFLDVHLMISDPQKYCDEFIKSGANLIVFHIEAMENKEKTTTPEMPDIDVLFELADLFKVFGDSTRLRIMYTISENEMSVLNIAEALSMEQSTISHQLRVLRQNKLVRVRREGKQIYYSLDDDHVKRIIEMGLDHVLE